MNKNIIYKKIKNLSAELGYVVTKPNIVQPATAYFDLLGDELRRQLFVVQNSMSGSGSQDFILRPEFTICIAQDYIQNLSSNDIKPARLAYSGSVFRSDENNQAKESRQSGIEIIAAEDCFKADIEVIEYALKVINALKIDNVELQMGDYDLFFTLLKNLNISDIWRNKLKRLFLSNDNLENLLQQLNAPQGQPIQQERAAFLKTIEGLEANAAQKLVENVLSFSGIDLIGGRSAGEIAERFLEQAALAATPKLPQDIVQILAEFFAINGSATQSMVKLNALNQKYGLKLGDNIAALSQRFAAIEALNIDGYDQDSIQFNAILGRGFEYYTGMVFELVDADKRSDKPLIGGGRYDSLSKHLGATTDINAVGASLWDAHLALLLQPTGGDV